jgi:hypothetical protein
MINVVNTKAEQAQVDGKNKEFQISFYSQLKEKKTVRGIKEK